MKNDKKKFFVFLYLIISLDIFVLSFGVFARTVQYDVNTGECPLKHTARLVEEIKQIYNKGSSLLDIKKRFIQQNWKEEFFLSTYRLQLYPLVNEVQITMNCSRPLFRVHFKNNDLEIFEKTLAEDGHLYGPHYEYLYYHDRNVNKKNRTHNKVDLSYLTIAEKHRENKKFFSEIKNLFQLQQYFFKRYVSEVIFDDDDMLTFVLRHSGGSSVVYFGKNLWVDKLQALKSIMTTFEKKNVLPHLLDLTDLKKVVVKFPKAP